MGPGSAQIFEVFIGPKVLRHGQKAGLLRPLKATVRVDLGKNAGILFVDVLMHRKWGLMSLTSGSQHSELRRVPLRKWYRREEYSTFVGVLWENGIEGRNIRPLLVCWTFHQSNYRHVQQFEAPRPPVTSPKQPHGHVRHWPTQGLALNAAASPATMRSTHRNGENGSPVIWM